MHRYPIPEQLKSEYVAHLAEARIHAARQLYILAIFLFTIFALVDVWALPSAITTVWKIRAVEIAILLAAFFFTRHRFFLEYYASTMIISFLVAGCGIEAMLYLATTEDLARNLYYAGMLLAVMGIYSFCFLPEWQAAIAGFSLVVIYLLIAAMTRDMENQQEVFIAITHGFFLVSANVLGIFAARQRNQYIRESFLLRKNLAEDLVRTQYEKQQSDFLSEHDPLTSLPNRKKLMRELSENIEAMRSAGQLVALLFIDLDGFKEINDNHGHAAGDEILKAIAGRLHASVRENDLVARYGGDEFAIMLNINPGDRETAMRVANTVLKSIEKPVRHSVKTLKFSASIGIAFFPDHASDAEMLIRIADQSMYDAKRQGKGRVSLTVEDEEPAQSEALVAEV